MAASAGGSGAGSVSGKPSSKMPKRGTMVGGNHKLGTRKAPKKK